MCLRRSQVRAAVQREAQLASQLAAKQEQLIMAKALVNVQSEGSRQTAALNARIAAAKADLAAAERAKGELAAEVQILLKTAAGVLDGDDACQEPRWRAACTGKLWDGLEAGAPTPVLE